MKERLQQTNFVGLSVGPNSLDESRL